MRRLLAQSAKVINRSDQPAAKKVMPDAIHHDSCGQGIARTGEFARQFEASANFGSIRSTSEHFEITAGDRFFRTEMISPFEQRRIVSHGLNETGRAPSHRNFSFQRAKFGD